MLVPDLYDDRFFESLREPTMRSARAVVPLILELVDAHSVVDIGCGEGVWLRAFKDAGVPEVLGIDGSQALAGLQIAPEDFLEADLERELPTLPRRFDLALCLEVAEHLPGSKARTLVALLTAAAPVVLFSAAIPGQVGTNHINCQWPEYWAAMFADHQYQAVDCVRPQVWGHAEVEHYYQQNIILYLAAGVALPAGHTAGPPRRLVHHLTYEHQLHLNAARRSTRTLVRELATAVPTSVRHRFTSSIKDWH